MIITAVPTVYNFTVDANADFNQTFQWTLPNGTLIDLTGFSAVLTIASDYYTNPNRDVFWTATSGPESPTVVTVRGTIDPTDVVTLRATNSSLPGGHSDSSYTVLDLDTLADVAAGLAAAVIANTDLSAIGITAVYTVGNSFVINQTGPHYATLSQPTGSGDTEMLSFAAEITFPMPTAGVFQILIAAAVTSLFTFQTAVFDLLLTSPSGAVTRLLQGPVTIDPGVTDDRPG